MHNLNKMMEEREKYSNAEILRQSQLVDRLIVEYMKECGDKRKVIIQNGADR